MLIIYGQEYNWMKLNDDNNTCEKMKLVNDLVLVINDTDVVGLIVEKEVKNGVSIHTYEYLHNGERLTAIEELPLNAVVHTSKTLYEETKKRYDLFPRGGDITKQEITI